MRIGKHACRGGRERLARPPGGQAARTERSGMLIRRCCQREGATGVQAGRGKRERRERGGKRERGERGARHEKRVEWVTVTAALSSSLYSPALLLVRLRLLRLLLRVAAALRDACCVARALASLLLRHASQRLLDVHAAASPRRLATLGAINSTAHDGRGEKLQACKQAATVSMIGLFVSRLLLCCLLLSLPCFIAYEQIGVGIRSFE